MFLCHDTHSKASLLWVRRNFSNLLAVYWNLQVKKTVCFQVKFFTLWKYVFLSGPIHQISNRHFTSICFAFEEESIPLRWILNSSWIEKRSSLTTSLSLYSASSWPLHSTLAKLDVLEDLSQWTHWTNISVLLKICESFRITSKMKADVFLDCLRLHLSNADNAHKLFGSWNFRCSMQQGSVTSLQVCNYDFFAHTSLSAPESIQFG